MDSIFKYHRDMIRLYGRKSSLALGWRDADSQLSRFKVLSGIADLNGSSVLDAGCGYADLLPYLRKLYPGLGAYCGVEQIPELLDEAVLRHVGEPGISFVSGNFMAVPMPVMDYVLASGSLNYSSPDPDFIYKAISRLFAHCRLGLGFNLLGKVPYKGFLAAYHPDEITAYCRTLSDRVVVNTGYSDEDFTVYVYR